MSAAPSSSPADRRGFPPSPTSNLSWSSSSFLRRSFPVHGGEQEKERKKEKESPIAAVRFPAGLSNAVRVDISRSALVFIRSQRARTHYTHTPSQVIWLRPAPCYLPPPFEQPCCLPSTGSGHVLRPSPPPPFASSADCGATRVPPVAPRPTVLITCKGSSRRLPMASSRLGNKAPAFPPSPRDHATAVHFVAMVACDHPLPEKLRSSLTFFRCACDTWSLHQ